MASKCKVIALDTLLQYPGLDLGLRLTESYLNSTYKCMHRIKEALY